jgi:shikimate dehydrogenase
VSFRRACVIGHPVAHSRSPLIHKHWLAELKIEGDYVRQDVPPEQIAAFLKNFGGSGFVGANVTVPHKEAAFRALKRPDPVAAHLKAANTLWLENGELNGMNTDVYGFLAHLDESVPDWNRGARSAVVLGAGGAARAIVYALIQRGLEKIYVVNRTLERAEAIAQEFGKGVSAAAWNTLPAKLREASLVVNATSLGMSGQPQLDVDLKRMRADSIVYDIVYVPLETPLLASARARGLRAVDGLGMLLHQAVPGFEKWFGVRPKVSHALRAVLLQDLGAKGRAS